MMNSAFSKEQYYVDKFIGKEGAEKPVILIKSCLETPEFGKPAKLELLDGLKIQTSRVANVLLGSQIYIETRSTIYVDENHYYKMRAR